MVSRMNKNWYYMKKDRRKCGPFSEEECIRLIRQEIIEPSDFIWNTYMENWLRLSDSIYSFYIPGNK